MALEAHIEEDHANSTAKHVKNIIYGGIDGIITTFSIIAACFGAKLEIEYIITMSIANLLADAFSMGFGDYISGYFENLYIMSEKKKEEYEFVHNKDYEIEEMRELYINEGFDEEDSTKIVDILISKDKYANFFIKRMVSMELGLEIPEKNFKTENRKNGIITFTAFIIFGFIPIIIYLVSYLAKYNEYTTIFIIDCFITTITMSSLGVYQAVITKQSKINGAICLTINGGISTTIAFLIGFSLEKIIL